jgi:hypothetical protein
MLGKPEAECGMARCPERAQVGLASRGRVRQAAGWGQSYPTSRGVMIDRAVGGTGEASMH